MLRKLITWLCICIFIVVEVTGQDVSFQAHAESDKIGIKDQFTVTYSISNASSLDDFNPPSFSGFNIIAGPHQSNSSSISVINGRTRQTSSVNITYVLQPKKIGNFTIPPASVVANGEKIQSNNITLEVVEGNISRRNPRQQKRDPFDDPFFDDPFASLRKRQQAMQQQRQQESAKHRDNIESLKEEDLHKNIFIKATVDKLNPRIGEQINVSYKLYTRLPMSVNLTQLPSLNGFWSQDVQIPNPPKPVQETINGKQYQVYLLKKTALFPQQSGDLELDAAKAEGIVRVIEEVKGKHPFADDPFFSSFFMDDPAFSDDIFTNYNYKDVQVKLSSSPIKIKVTALPVDSQPEYFTGAVGDFTISAEVDKSSFSTDEVSTLKVTIKGNGNIKLIGEPKTKFSPELGIYDPVVTDTITGRLPVISGEKTFAYSINPINIGTFTIAPIKFSYYDVQAKRYKTIQTQPITLNVTKGKNFGESVAQEDKLPRDIHNIYKGKVDWSKKSSSYIISSIWFYLLLIIPFILYIILNEKRKRDEKYKENIALFRNKKANKIAWKRLSVARKHLLSADHKQFYDEISKAIWLYLSDKLGISLAHLSKENISVELSSRKLSEDIINRVQYIISECELALYSKAGGQSKRNMILDETADLITTLENNLKLSSKQRLKEKAVINYSLILVLLSSMSTISFGQMKTELNYNKLWDKANGYYESRLYDSAVHYYTLLVDAGVKNKYVYFNLANSYYRLNNVGMSILNYKKALYLSPNDKGIKDNLILAENRILQQSRQLNPVFFVRWWDNLMANVHSNLWTIISVIFFSLTLVILYYRKGFTRTLYRRLVTTSFTTTILFLALGYFSYHHFQHSKDAVILNHNTPLLNTPQEGSKSIALLPEGITVSYLQRQNNFVQIELPNGRIGWSDAESMARVKE